MFIPITTIRHQHMAPQYEIQHNPKTVDLLVSLAYVSASDGAMEDPLPVGLGLRVPLPSTNVLSAPQAPHPDTLVRPYVPGPAVVEQPTPPITLGPDGLCEFDELNLAQVCQPFHLYVGELELNYGEYRCAGVLQD